MLRSTPDVNGDTENDEIGRLKEEFASLTSQMQQLEQANQAWARYQQHQWDQLRDRFQLNDIESNSFDETLQQLETRFHDVTVELQELQEFHSDIFLNMFLFKIFSFLFFSL